MGKNKPKDEAPNPNSVANRETFQRLNFLYQASAYLKGIETTATATATDRNSRKKSGKRRRAGLGELGSSYVHSMRTIGHKAVVRMDPNVKRTLCKGCDTVLVPGTTASVRVKSSSAIGHKVAYTCLGCHTLRIIPAPPVAPPTTTVPSSDPALAPSTSLQMSTPETTLAQQNPYRKRKRKPPVPRRLPLFARGDAGHAVFRGNDMVRSQD